MSDHSDYDKIWAEKADEQLFDALTHTDEYEPAAIEAVQREIARRHLDTQRVSELYATAAKRTGEEAAEEAAKAELPLQWPMRILLFLLGFLTITVILEAILAPVMWQYYKDRGYTKKSREVWRWMVYGLLFSFPIVIILGYLFFKFHYHTEY